MTSPNQMNVTRIRGGFGNYEWATICWVGWQATGMDNSPRECGEILIHSSFGSWANSWGHLGIPFEQWLPKAEMSYCAEKFMGSKARSFDGHLTVQSLLHLVIEWRKAGNFDREQARAVWDWIDDNRDRLESSSDLFCATMFDGARACGLSGRAAGFFEEPWELCCTSLDRSFAGFWRDLWPVFIERLNQRAETQKGQ